MDEVWNDAAFLARFDAKVEQHASGCWLWTGWRIRGRAALSYRGRNYLATRFAKVIADRAWPSEGLIACHRCDNPSCVNPEHIWWGTVADNNRDARDKGRHRGPGARSHCSKGHEFRPETTRMDGRGARVCKLCAADRQQRWLAKQSSARLGLSAASLSRGDS